MRLPGGADRFILLTMFAGKSICPSLERVTSENAEFPSCPTTKRGSLMCALPPMRSRSPFQLLPQGGVESMKSNPCAGKASAASVEPCRSAPLCAAPAPAGHSAFGPLSAPDCPTKPARGRPGRRPRFWYTWPATSSGSGAAPRAGARLPGPCTAPCRRGRPGRLGVRRIDS